MMTLQVERFTKGRKIALCIIIVLFAAFLVVGTTWIVGGRGGGGDGGDGKQHTSLTGECTVCHGADLKAIHQESWSDDRTGCDICHIPPGKKDLYIGGASFDCRSCHALEPSEDKVDYHMEMGIKHTPEGTFFTENCEICHGTSGSLPEVHEGLGLVGHLPLTVDCPVDVADIEDDIYCYCLECHKNPDRIPVLPDNAECTSCHDDAASYDPTSNQCHHDNVDSHDDCADCHIQCPE
jgi:hypothetical protein